MKKIKGGKNRITKDIMAKGFTARKAERALDTVIKSWTFAAWTGETVELPGGTIQAQYRQGIPRREFQKFKNVNTHKPMHRFIKYPGRRRVVKFMPDERLDLTPPPPPETPEEIEARQLATELLGLKQPANDKVMATLQQAVEVHPHKPGALLRRLRQMKTRDWKFDSVYSLAEQITAHYWI